jgi:hypothetical protein
MQDKTDTVAQANLAGVTDPPPCFRLQWQDHRPTIRPAACAQRGEPGVLERIFPGEC